MLYIHIYIHIDTYTYRHHSDNRSMPIDQQGLGRPKAGDKVIDQQGAGCQENPAQSEDARLKAQVQIHRQVSEHCDRICTAALIFIGPKCQPSQGTARSKSIDKHNHPL